MSACPNCNTKLSCGCQKRTATNGAQVCSTCIGSYESNLRSGLQAKITPSTVKVFRPLKKDNTKE